MRAMSGESYTAIKVSKPREDVVHVTLNRPEKRNAMNSAFFNEVKDCFQKLDNDSDCRAVVLSGEGKIFTAGLDLADLGAVIAIREDPNLDSSRKAFKLRSFLTNWQESFSMIEQCSKPVIAAVHSACVGGGVDLTSACDIRYCSQDAWFQIKEIDIGLAADLGTLQRFPKVIGNDSYARELAFTARQFYAEEAKQMGFVSRILPDQASLIEAALDTASLIATKSPIAVQGTKVSMVYSRDHTVAQGLEHIGIWNQAMLQSDDVMEAAQAAMTKGKAKFSKLEIKECFLKLAEDNGCRAVVLSGAGKLFSSGLDLSSLGSSAAGSGSDVGRKAFKMRKGLAELQESFSVIEKCSKPVIAAVHSACVGGGVDLTSACDIRYCSQDAWFQIKEVDIGIAADLGTLQRFPKVIGNASLASELALTARKLYAKEAKQIGFVSRILPDQASLIEAALDTASFIAMKSPAAVQGTKVSMVYSRDHTVAEGLEHIGISNTSVLQSGGLMNAANAKQKANLSKL